MQSHYARIYGSSFRKEEGEAQGEMLEPYSLEANSGTGHSIFSMIRSFVEKVCPWLFTLKRRLCLPYLEPVRKHWGLKKWGKPSL